MEAAITWATAVINLAFTFALVGVIDMLLFQRGEPTVTDFLRLSPWWFITPAIAVNVALIALAIHLYLMV